MKKEKDLHHSTLVLSAASSAFKSESRALIKPPSSFTSSIRCAAVCAAGVMSRATESTHESA